MWAEVVDASIEDELGEVRLGGSFELGTFLGNDLVKGRDPTRCVPGPKSLKLSLFAVERGLKTFITLRDDVHNFIEACEKRVEAGKDLYSVVTEYGAKGKARQAGEFPSHPLSDEAFDHTAAYTSDCALGSKPSSQ